MTNNESKKLAALFSHDCLLACLLAVCCLSSRLLIASSNTKESRLTATGSFDVPCDVASHMTQRIVALLCICDNVFIFFEVKPFCS
uniref:Secreted protein n=1 Tax=Parascaris equorum TaxID=6256 RepID=A0A914RIQ6_PAREQ